MTRAERAVALHNAGSACSQAVFAVFAEEFGLDVKLAHKLSGGLGGGIGRKGMDCGAVTGGALALSLMYGAESSADQESKLKTYRFVADLVEFIEKKHGSSQCRVLLGGLDLWKDGDRAKMSSEGIADRVCNSLIRDVVNYVEGVAPKVAK